MVTAGVGALPTFDPKTGDLLVVVDTPGGSRNKYRFDPSLQTFALRRVLPSGMVFPYDFGFLPSTLGDDGDPLDVLLLSDAPLAVGCVAHVRAIGAIEARQRNEAGLWIRNDRILAVAASGKAYSDIRETGQLKASLLDEIEAFFRQYNALDGREFEPLNRSGASAAMALVRAGSARASAATASFGTPSLGG